MTHDRGRESDRGDFLQRMGDLGRTIISGFFGQSGEKERKPPASKLVVLIAAGIVLMLLGQRMSGIGGEDSASTAGESPPNAAATTDDPVHETARQLEAALSRMDGVGQVHVVIVPAVSAENVYAEEVQRRASTVTSANRMGDGDSVNEEIYVTRRPIVMRIDGGRTEEALVRYTKRPEIAGVLIVADGARDPQIQWRILSAASTALGVASHRIEVVPKQP